MPSTRISTGTWVRGREQELIEAVQAALLETLAIPDWDRDVVVQTFEGNERIVPTNNSARFTRIEVILFAGRRIDVKRALYKAIVHRLGVLGVPAQEIKTILLEMPAENWGLKGGLPASEVDFLTQ